MKILFCGDIVGKSGRSAIKKYVLDLKKKLNLDLVIANAENAAHGFGITPKIYKELSSYGIDIFTLGNHFLDQPVITEYLDNKTNIIRPLNILNNAPGKGYNITKVNNKKVLVVSLMGQLFMKGNIESPFITMDKILNNFKLGINIDIIIVDFHAEATSEKNAMFLYLDGRVTSVLGTHTHIPTIDYRILSKGTAVQTDVGMCGDYSGVLGMDYSSSLQRFVCNDKNSSDNLSRLTPLNQASTLCGSLIEIDDDTKLVERFSPIVIGDILQNTI